MSTNIDFKALWNQQTTATPSINVLLKEARQFKRKHLYQLIFANISLTLTSIFIVVIWYYFQPQFITTKIGIVMVILAMVIFLIVYNMITPLLMNNKNLTTKSYLQQLLKLKEKQRFLQTVMMNIYFLLLSIGICMYMYEYTSRMELVWAFVCYAITLTWFGINWFYFRPKVIKKQRDKINTLINQFSEFNKQLNSF